MSSELHAAQLGLALWVALGPVPVSLAVLAATERTPAEASPARNWLVLLTVWCAIGSATVIALGAAHALSLLGLCLATGVIFAAGLLLLRARGLASLPPLLPATGFATGEILALGTLSSLGLALLFRLSTQPIVDYDSLSYHLPAVAQWVQTGTLARIEQFARLNSLYPYSWEALCTLFVLPFREDYLVAFPNLVAWVLLGLGIYCLSRELGASRAAGSAAVAAALSMPELLGEVWALRVDLALAACFAAALVFSVRYARLRTSGYLGLFLLSLGVMAGSKGSGLVYGAVATICLLACLIPRAVARLDEGGKRGASRWLVVLCMACALLIGTYWYGRNWVTLGNPLAPVTVKLGGHVLFAGYLSPQDLRRTTLAAAFNPWDMVDWGILGKEISSRLSWPFYALLALGLLGFAALGAKQKAVRNAHLAGALVLVGLTAYLYTITPYSADNGQHHWQITPWTGQALRYAYPCCAVLAVAGALGATGVRLPRLVLLVISLAAPVFALQQIRAMAMLVATVAFWAGLRLVQRPHPGGESRVRFDRGAVVLLVCVGLPALVFGSYLARLWHERQRVLCYGHIVEAVPTLVGRGEKIGYLDGTQTYLLYGADLSQRVVRIGLKTQDGDTWRRYLREHHIGVVAAGPFRTRGPARSPAEWLESERSPLVRIYGDPTEEPSLYRLR